MRWLMRPLRKKKKLSSANHRQGLLKLALGRYKVGAESSPTNMILLVDVDSTQYQTVLGAGR